MERLHPKNTRAVWQFAAIALAIAAVFSIGKFQSEMPRKPNQAKPTSAPTKQPEQAKKEEATPLTKASEELQTVGAAEEKKEAAQAAPTIPQNTQNERLLILSKERDNIAERLNSAKQELSKNEGSLELQNSVKRLEIDGQAINREISLLIDKKQIANNFANTAQKNNDITHVRNEKNLLESPPSHGGDSQEKPHFEAWDIFQNYGHKKEIQDEHN